MPVECEVGLHIPAELGTELQQTCHKRVEDALSKLFGENQQQTIVKVESHPDYSRSSVTVTILYAKTQLWIKAVKLIRRTLGEMLSEHYEIRLMDQHTGSPINLRIAA